MPRNSASISLKRSTLHMLFFLSLYSLALLLTRLLDVVDRLLNDLQLLFFLLNKYPTDFMVRGYHISSSGAPRSGTITRNLLAM